jgi:hypothetical protein
VDPLLPSDAILAAATWEVLCLLIMGEVLCAVDLNERVEESWLLG